MTRCIVCNRPLHGAESRRRRIGPVCQRRLQARTRGPTHHQRALHEQGPILRNGRVPAILDEEAGTWRDMEPDDLTRQMERVARARVAG